MIGGKDANFSNTSNPDIGQPLSLAIHIIYSSHVFILNNIVIFIQLFDKDLIQKR